MLEEFQILVGRRKGLATFEINLFVNITLILSPYLGDTTRRHYDA
jgi:hypothetical protein